MYLWKYWRESRLAFGASLVGVAGLLVLILLQHLIVDTRGGYGGFTNVLPMELFIQAVPLAFVAWIYGSFGVGHDLGERSGSYLFSRPRSYASFVWRDWSFGLVQLLLITVALNLVIGVEIYRLLHLIGDPYRGNLLIAGKLVPVSTVVWLHCVGAFVLAGLVFGLTYFSTILTRHAKGVMLGAGILLVYILVKQTAEHYWPWLNLPNLVPTEYASSGEKVTGFAKDLGVDLAIRAAVILIFPFAAELLLRKRDIE